MVLTFVKRATSPLNFEPIDTPPEDILYPGSDQEDEYDEKKRAKRKLRVELLGRQYLEGRPLFIQSAGLKGPFERGWVNPWASKKRKRGIDGIQRSYGTPATKEDGFRRSTEAEKGSSTVKRTSVKDSEFVQSTSDLHKRASTATGLAEQEGYTAKRRRHEQREEPNGDHDASKSISAGASTTQQGSWLKTNQTYLQRNVRNDRKSPTPTPATRDRVQKNATPPPSKLQSQMTPIPKVPHVQRKSGQPSGFTPINGPSESKDKANPLAKTTKVLSRSVQHDNGDRHDSAYIRVKEMDLATANEVTRRGYEEVKRLSQEAVRQTALDDRNHQAKRLSQEAVSGAHRSSARDSSRLQPYVSEVVTIDDECTTAGLRAKSRAPRPSPHAVPMSIYQPDFQYRYAAKSSSSGSSREKAPFFKATEEIQSRARATSSSSSSSGSDAFAEALEAAQAKAGSKSLVSSHSSSPAVEGLETTSVKKNTNGIRRLIFTPSGSAKFAQRRTLARPSSSSSAAGPTISPLQDTENKASAFKGNALARKESAKSSDLPISNGGYSRSSAVLPEAQVAGDALIQHSQKPSGPSTSLLETEKPSPKFPSLDEGDSYVNLSTQAAFLKAQRSFKDEVLKSLKDSPLESKIVKTSPGASKQSGPDATTPANGGRLHGTISRWKDVTSQDTEDEEVMSTQAMVDAMSPFAITTVKRRPPLNERTSLAPSPTMRNPSMSTPTLSPDLPAVSALRDHHPPPSFNESLAQKFLLGFYGPHQQMPTNSDLESKAHIRPRHIACNNCRKNKRRCIHDVLGNEDPIRAVEQALPRPHARKQFRERQSNNLSQPSQEEVHNPISAPSPPSYSLSMSTSPSQNPSKPSPSVPLSHPNKPSKPPSSLMSFSILPNGTLTETSVFQDGQQPQQDWDTSLPLDPFGLTSDEPNGSSNTNGDKQPKALDLNAAIDDASSFLGDWDVEAEATKEGSYRRKKESENGVKGILSAGKWGG